MLRKLFFISLIIFWAAGCQLRSGILTEKPEVLAGPKMLEATAEESRPTWVLPEHEKLMFRVKWIGISAGKITAEIKGIEEIRGRKAYRIEVTAQTTGFCSTLYKIDDRYISWLDVEKLYTLRHEVHRREGGYIKDAVTDFDQEAHKAYFHNETDGTSKVFDIPPDTQDTMTAAYVARTLALKEQRSYAIKICNSEKNYDIFLTVPSRDRISVPELGERDVLVLKPYGQFRGEEVREGRLNGFVSVEPGHTPYLIVIKAPVFTSVTATLISNPS